jgi:hypothetical protein
MGSFIGNDKSLCQRVQTQRGMYHLYDQPIHTANHENRRSLQLVNPRSIAPVHSADNGVQGQPTTIPKNHQFPNTDAAPHKCLHSELYPNVRHLTFSNPACPCKYDILFGGESRYRRRRRRDRAQRRCRCRPLMGDGNWGTSRVRLKINCRRFIAQSIRPPGLQTLSMLRIVRKSGRCRIFHQFQGIQMQRECF